MLYHRVGDVDSYLYDYIDSPNHEHHNIDRCGWQQTRDALADERTKREEAERNFAALRVMCANVSGALCDAHHPDVVVYERDYARSVRELTAQRNALQTEVERMRGEVKKALYRDEVEDGEPNDYEEAVAWWHEMVKHCKVALSQSPTPTEKK
jgi:hypothetical protein